MFFLLNDSDKHLLIYLSLCPNSFSPPFPNVEFLSQLALDKQGQVTSPNLAVTLAAWSWVLATPRPPPLGSPLGAPQGPLEALVSGSGLCSPSTLTPTKLSWQLPSSQMQSQVHPCRTRQSRFQNGCFRLQFKKVLPALTFLQFLTVVIVMAWDHLVRRKKTPQTRGSPQLLPRARPPPSLSQGGGDLEADTRPPWVFTLTAYVSIKKKKKIGNLVVLNTMRFHNVLCFQNACEWSKA